MSCDVFFRFMMLIDGVDQVFMLDRDNTVFHVPKLTFPKRKDLNSYLANTLVDGVSKATYFINIHDFRFNYIETAHVFFLYIEFISSRRHRR